MKNKYYIPTIEEFHVGFEYELLKKVSKYDNGWRFNIIKKIFIPIKANNDFDWIRLKIDLKDKEIRVKYLDKEDIESLGWIFGEKYKDRYKIAFVEDNLTIGIYDDALDQVLFTGTIRNKSELIKLMRQIGL